MKFKVLVIEDNPDHAELVEYALSKSKLFSCEVILCKLISEVKASNGLKVADVVLSDLNLPDSDQKETLEFLKNHCQLPFLIMTSLEDQKVLEGLIRMGASDCLSKEQLLNPSILERAIYYAIERHKVQQHLVEEKQNVERANLAKSVFLSNMSHEIRTPLNAILGFAQLLSEYSEQKQDTESIELLSYIKNSGDHLLGLINDILDLAKIESGNVVMMPEEIPTIPFLKQLMQLLESTSQLYDVKVALLEDHWPPTLFLDPMRLRQILINLLSNGIKYNTKGGLCQLEASLQEELLTIKVSDEGKGIASEQIEKLFVPFDRLGMEKQCIQGTGIGLSITKNLVNLMGGEIHVESEVGKGTTFYVNIPLSFLKEKEKEPPLAMIDDLNRVKKKGPRVKARSDLLIYYVEDTRLSQKLMGKVLSKYGIAHKIFSTAEEGLSALKSDGPPTLLLLDINLPGMSGIEVAKIIRKEIVQDFPIIALSADAMEPQQNMALESGIDEYMTKPFKITELMNRLQGLCEEVFYET